MAKRQKAEEVGDNGDLQALFDSIADQAGKQTSPPQLEVVASSDGVGDSDDLQNLFDTVASAAPAKAAAKMSAVPSNEAGDSPDLEALFDEVSSAAVPASGAATHAASTPEERQENVFHRVGQMTRLLHDTIRELGYDRMISETAQKLPDARQRLSYISQMTEQAASRVLNATDIAKPIQDRVEEHAASLDERWEKLYAKQLSVDEFKALAADTRSFFNQTAADSKVVNAQLMEIMMAQDFQDLTGQVIKKIVDMAATLETELLKVLIEVVPEDKRTPDNEGLLNGPVINAEGRTDVVTGQEQVDDLLESLGF
ncbi:protein phosphatase CheZ [Uliginosibacterium sp. H3]|uniref:Protein phosphatase CheZ n=1 Tax=Uliginosibacterium silvisoli TaxID=3114758 RepID=A0ABU6KA85_9RHOO|nr:protein phosphatase CheZ [Uliginosibacterium sp. H3]